MTNEERWKEYQICKVRGHAPSDRMASNYIICKFCNTYYTFSTPQLIETMKPTDPDATS